MSREAEDEMIQKEYRDDIELVTQGFKTVIDFYRMEYSEDFLELFNEFGYLLICRLSYTDYFTEVKGVTVRNRRDGVYEKISDQPEDEIEHYIRQWERSFRANLMSDKRFSAFVDFRITIKKGSVMRPMLLVIEELFDLYESRGSIDLLYQSVRRIHDLCINYKTPQSRYILPDHIVEQLVRLMTSDADWAFKEGPLPKTILDPQYGPGTMLIAGGQYFDQQIRLCGFENDGKWQLAANILCVLSNTEVEQMGADFLADRSKELYDLVLANPAFNKDPVLYDSFNPAYEAGLHAIKSKYHMFILRCLQVLEVQGRAALVVPDSFLFSSKRESLEVRRWILTNYLVEGIIALPEKTFYANSLVNSSVLIISNPLMVSGWTSGTECVFFYQLKTEEENLKSKEEYQKLERIWRLRPQYYDKWQLSEPSYNYNNIKTPDNWKYQEFWFADIETIQNADWSLLPDHYKPAEKRQLKLEDPDKLLLDLIRAQEDVLNDIKDLYEEVRGL